MQEYYIYCYMDPRKPTRIELGTITLLFEPFYIGKGKGDRMNDHMQNLKRNTNPIFRAKLNKLKSLGEDWPYRTKIAWFDNEQEAYEAEEVAITKIGSNFITEIDDGPLTNILLGKRPPCVRGKTYEEIYGDQADEQRKKRAALQKAAGGYFSGRTHQESSKSKIGQKLRQLQANGGFRKGILHNDDTRAKMSESTKRCSSGRIVRHIIGPDQTAYAVYDIKTFCIEMGISRSTIEKSFREGWEGGVCSGKTKGWKIKTTKSLPDDLCVKVQQGCLQTFDKFVDAPLSVRALLELEILK